MNCFELFFFCFGLLPQFDAYILQVNTWWYWGKDWTRGQWFPCWVTDGAPCICHARYRFSHSFFSDGLRAEHGKTNTLCTRQMPVGLKRRWTPVAWIPSGIRVSILPSYWSLKKSDRVPDAMKIWYLACIYYKNFWIALIVYRHWI